MSSGGNVTNVKIAGGFWSMLGLIFITLKLAGIGAVAGWSWWLVLAPLWGPPAVVLGIGLVVLVIFFLFLLIAGAVTWLRG